MSRKIAIEVPENTCDKCKLVQSTSYGATWTCPFRKDMSYSTREFKPVKACRDEEVSQ